jgi:hypothetical protein
MAQRQCSRCEWPGSVHIRKKVPSERLKNFTATGLCIPRACWKAKYALPARQDVLPEDSRPGLFINRSQQKQVVIRRYYAPPQLSSSGLVRDIRQPAFRSLCQPVLDCHTTASCSATPSNLILLASPNLTVRLPLRSCPQHDAPSYNYTSASQQDSLHRIAPARGSVRRGRFTTPIATAREVQGGAGPNPINQSLFPP